MYKYKNRLNKILTIFNGNEKITVNPGEVFSSDGPIPDPRLTLFTELPSVKPEPEKKRGRRPKTNGDNGET